MRNNLWYKWTEVKEGAKCTRRNFYKYHHELCMSYRRVKEVIEEPKEEIKIPLKKIKKELRKFEKFNFKDKEIEDTYYYKFYADMMRTLKEMEVEKDCSVVRKKLEEAEEKLERVKTAWFQNHHWLETVLNKIIRESLKMVICEHLSAWYD